MPLAALGRVFTGYPSAYNAAQVQVSKVRRYQRATLQADFNGSIPKAALIESVTWDCTSPWVTFLSDPAVSADQKSVSVDVRFNYSGFGAIKATVTLDDATEQNYEFQYQVSDSPRYPEAQYDSASGPFSVTAVAP